MRYEAMGPLRIVKDNEVTVIGPPKMEIVLVVLLIRSDQVVTLDQLMIEIWGDDPPRSAVPALYVYVSQLRKALRNPDRPQSPIVTQHPGYVLRKGADEIDFQTFQQMVSQGRRHAQRRAHENAVELFEDAISLWRGLLLADARGGPILQGFATWLAELRLECLEMLVESSLALGRHRELVGRLYALAAENPLREVFYRQLMLALYRSERRAEALDVYQMARLRLREDLGLEPGPSLQSMHRSILTADAWLNARTA